MSPAPAGGATDLGVRAFAEPMREQLGARAMAFQDMSGAGGVQVSTVDAFQGAEKDIIVLSTCRSQSQLGFTVTPHRLNVALTRNLTWISTIGSNAPYVGLLGTVFGILITFYDIGQSSNIEPAAIMTGLALALKATAAGLLVAIPSIMIYNGLLRRVEVITANWKTSQDDRHL